MFFFPYFEAQELIANEDKLNTVGLIRPRMLEVQ